MRLVVHNHFSRWRTRDLAVGSYVYDIEDPRHLGTIEQINRLPNGTEAARIKWEETGWKSMGVPVANLRRAERHDPPSEIKQMKSRLGQDAAPQKFVTSLGNRNLEITQISGTPLAYKTLGRYAVWAQQNGRPQVIEVSGDLDALLQKHNLSRSDVRTLGDSHDCDHDCDCNDCKSRDGLGKGSTAHRRKR